MRAAAERAASARWSIAGSDFLVGSRKTLLPLGRFYPSNVFNDDMVRHHLVDQSHR